MATVNGDLARNLCAAVNRIRDLQDAIADLRSLGAEVTVHFCGVEYDEADAIETLKQAGYPTEDLKVRCED